MYGCQPASDGRAAGPVPGVEAFTSEADAPLARRLPGLAPIQPEALPDAAVVAVGKKLFHDPRLSRDGTISCATCHDVANGGDDGLPVSVGIDGRTGTVNAPTVLNSSLNFAQFWDGRAETLAEQAPGPIHNPAEMDSNWPATLTALRADPELRAEFELAGLGNITSDSVVRAIVAYERALVTRSAPFDRWLLGDDEAISEQARSGAALFVAVGCVSCHQGRNVGGNMFQRSGVFSAYAEDRDDVTPADLGRYNVTGREQDRFVFKVPSLRTVTRTAPYFHDGSVATLDEAVAIMGRNQLGRELSARERSALIAFLESLDGRVDERLL